MTNTATDADTADIASLLSHLKQVWHSTIPASEFMQVTPVRYNQGEFCATAPLPPNINLHHTMFAGSIYTLMTLTGWGAVWLQQQLAGVEGDIVLADAQIRYLAPVMSTPRTKVCWPEVSLAPLARGGRVKVKLSVELHTDDGLCATFNGLYVTSPRTM